MPATPEKSPQSAPPSRVTGGGAKSGALRRVLDRQGFVVLDGGLATALEAAGHRLDTELWSARLLLDAPDAVRAVHSAFLQAGADCITTASYQASFPGFARSGIGPREGVALLRRSVELAVQAREEFWSEPQNRAGRHKPLVAASVGPYGAFLADGSEYDGRYGVSRDVLAAFHRTRLEVLGSGGTDVLALETIPSLMEVEVLVELLSELPHPGAWICFSCRDGAQLWDGSAVEDAVRACAPEAGVVAVGVNCTAPCHVASLVRRMRAATDLPILAYPNSGESYDASTGRWSGDAAERSWIDEVGAWMRAGARVLGGCCRVGPDAIREMRRLMEEVLEDEMEGGHAI